VTLAGDAADRIFEPALLAKAVALPAAEMRPAINNATAVHLRFTTPVQWRQTHRTLKVKRDASKVISWLRTLPCDG